MYIYINIKDIYIYTHTSCEKKKLFPCSHSSNYLWGISLISLFIKKSNVYMLSILIFPRLRDGTKCRTK